MSEAIAQKGGVGEKPGSTGSGFLKRHSLIVFFVLANAISWAIWALLVASAQGLLDRSFSRYLHLLGGIGPMLAAIIVTGITDRSAGIRELFGRMFRWRVGITWLLIGLFGPVAVFLLSAAIGRVFWGTWLDWSQFGRTEEFPHLPLLVYWIANMLFYGWGEETGWRGYALPRLQKGRSALSATLILSVFWALWHLPLFWFQMEMDIGGAIGWYFSILTGSILLTWLYNSTGGGILVVALFHGALDIVINTPSPGDLAFVMGVLITVWGILVLLVAGPTNLSRSEKHAV